MTATLTLPDHPMVRVAVMLAPSTDPRHVRQCAGMCAEIARHLNVTPELVTAEVARLAHMNTKLEAN